jgi:hypothetical protein
VIMRMVVRVIMGMSVSVVVRHDPDLRGARANIK